MNQLKILIVDDDQDNIYGVTEILERDKYRIINSCDPIAGFEMYKKENPAVVILDINMKGFSGLQFIQEMALGPDSLVSVIIMTGYGNNDVIKKCFDAGASVILHKPFNVFELRGIVKNLYQLEVYKRRVLKQNKNLEKHTIELDKEIQKRKEAEAALISSIEKERELIQLKSEFITSISHDFKTPLSTILSSVDLLEIKLDSGDNIQKIDLIRKVQSSVEQLNKMISEFIYIGSNKNSINNIYTEEVEVVSYVSELVKGLFINSYDLSKLNFKTNLSEFNCYIFPNLVWHIVNNLLSNAFKYSTNNSNIDVELNIDEGHFKIVVNDSGIGIAEDDKPFIFENFYRGKNARNSQGSGLGLSIVSNCVNLYKGKISFESNLGFGTRFEVTMPILNKKKKLFALSIEKA